MIDFLEKKLAEAVIAEKKLAEYQKEFSKRQKEVENQLNKRIEIIRRKLEQRCGLNSLKELVRESKRDFFKVSKGTLGKLAKRAFHGRFGKGRLYLVHKEEMVELYETADTYKVKRLLPIKETKVDVFEAEDEAIFNIEAFGSYFTGDKLAKCKYFEVKMGKIEDERPELQELAKNFLGFCPEERTAFPEGLFDELISS